jgi:hypothetical protein
VQLHRQLARLVERLPAEDRRIVVLRFFEERSSLQIGDLLAVPAATVRWRLGRALDQLRVWLDAESGGDRRRWLLALGSLLHPATATAPARLGLGLVGATGLLVAVAGIVAGVALSARREDAPPAIPVAPRVTAVRATTASPPTGSQVATTTVDSGRCAEGLARARAEFRALERDLRQYEDPALYFEKAAPRPSDNARWAPLMADLLAQDPSGVLECRDGICRIQFVHHPDVEWRLADGRALTSHLQGVDVKIDGGKLGGITRDPLSGELQQRQAQYLRLVREPPPIPGDPAACQREQARLAAELVGLRERQERALIPPVLFARSRETNRVATDQIRSWLEAQAGLRARSLAIECRDRICRIDPWPTWLQEIQRRPEWNQRLGGGFRGDDGAAYHRMRTPRPPTEEEIARDQYMKQFAAVVQPAIKRCADQHTQADQVNLEILWPAAGELNADGVAGRPSVRARGPDGQLSFGRCLGPAVSAALATLPPRPSAGAANSWFKVVGTRPPP